MNSFSIQVKSTEDEVFPCNEGDTVLGSALRSGKGFTYECNSGGCGSCQFELIQGEIIDLWPDAPGLSPRARNRGRRLACQSVPASDCEIRAALNEKFIPVHTPKRITVEFVQARPFTPDMSEFTFRGDQAAEFLPGQFAMLKMKGVNGLRAYSMCNLSNSEGYWKFVIKRVPGGKATTKLFDNLQAGENVQIDGPYGHGYLRTNNGRDIACVAGGAGLSPILSILSAAVRTPELDDKNFILFYGGRGPSDMCVTQVIEADPLLHERIRVVTAISDEMSPGATDWKGERGFIHELVKKVLGEGIPGYDYYFCGPPPMTDALQRMLMFDYKVADSQLYFDRFY